MCIRDRFYTFHLVRGNNRSVLCPTVMIDSRRYPMGRRSSGKNIHNHTFVVAVYLSLIHISRRDWHEWNASFLSSKRQTVSTEPTLIGGMVIRAK